MRSFVTTFVCCLALALSADFASAQNDNQGNKPKVQKKKIQIRPGGVQLIAPGFVRSIGGGNPAILLRNPQVQDELKLSADQKAKIVEINKNIGDKQRVMYGNARNLQGQERLKKFKEITPKVRKLREESHAAILKLIDEKQSARLDQIVLQQQGVRALVDKKVVAKLEITEDQQKKIKAAFDGQQKKQTQLAQDIKNGVLQRQDYAKKSAEIREETEKNAVDALTDAQKKKLEELKGKKFEMKFNRLRAVPANGIRIQAVPAGKIKGVQKIRVKAVPAQPKKK